jgi:hypothetical protein
MVDKGAPEMESVMGCFSAKLTERKQVHVISYSATKYENLFLLWWTSWNNGVLTLFNENMQVSVFLRSFRPNILARNKPLGNVSNPKARLND